MESSGQLLRQQAAVHDTRLVRVVVDGSETHRASITGSLPSAVLQGINDASSAGLKYLLLGAIHRCLINTTEAIQVSDRDIVHMASGVCGPGTDL